MIRMVKRVFGLISAFGTQLSLTTPVFAAEVPICPPGQFNPLCRLTEGKFGEIIGNLITLALIVAVIIALFFLIYGGIRWIMSGGDKTAIESARNTVVSAIVGLVIAFLAFFILNVIFNLFGLSLTNLQLPTLIKQ